MKLIYVSHPYGGKKINEDAVDDIIHGLAERHPGACWVSPIHAIRRDYNTHNYAEGLECCLALERRCDAVIMTGDWERSVGCRAEKMLADRRHKPVFFEGQDEDKFIDTYLKF